MKEHEIIEEVLKSLSLGSAITINASVVRMVKTQEIKKCYVVAFYPHHVLTVNENGFRECFLYYDLYQMLHGVALEERVEAL